MIDDGGHRARVAALPALDVPAEAKLAVVAAEAADERQLDPSDLYVVWSVKVLANWKALVSTDRESGVYWEVTRNGAARETYVDRYQKHRNTVLRSS